MTIFILQPVPVSRARSRLDSMIIPSDFPKMVSAETVAGGNTDPAPRVEESYKEASAKEVEINDNPSVERPVDLYKVGKWSLCLLNMSIGPSW